MEVFGLLDSGATASVLGNVCENVIQNLGVKITELSTSLRTDDGTRQGIIGFVELPVTYKGEQKTVLFYLSPTLR